MELDKPFRSRSEAARRFKSNVPYVQPSSLSNPVTSQHCLSFSTITKTPQYTTSTGVRSECGMVILSASLAEEVVPRWNFFPRTTPLPRCHRRVRLQAWYRLRSQQGRELPRFFLPIVRAGKFDGSCSLPNLLTDITFRLDLQPEMLTANVRVGIPKPFHARISSAERRHSLRTPSSYDLQGRLLSFLSFLVSLSVSWGYRVCH